MFSFFKKWRKKPVPPARLDTGRVTITRGENAENTLIKYINLTTFSKRRRDMQDWKAARDHACGETKTRKLLYELYWDVLSKDDFLASLSDKRRMPILNTPIIFKNQDGTENEEIAPIFDTNYFTTILKETINSELFGYSLLEVAAPKPNSIEEGSVVLIPRSHVKPELGIVVKDPYSTTGLSYLTPPQSNNTIAVGDPYSLGAYLQASKLSIRMENNIGDWGESNETYGMPEKHIKVDNEDEREKIKEQIEEAGAGATLITDKDVEIMYAGAGSGSGSANGTYDTLDKRLMERMAIRILGESMTTLDSRNSGYAQAQIHGDVSQQLNSKDRQLVIRTLNNQLLPILNRANWNLQGEFQFKEVNTHSTEEHIKVDETLLSMGVPLSKEELYERYKRNTPQDEEDTLTPRNVGRTNELKVKDFFRISPVIKSGAAKQHFIALHKLYNKDNQQLTNDVILPSLQKEINNTIARLFKGSLKAGEIDRKTFEKTYNGFVNNYNKTYKQNILKTKWNEPNWNFVQRVKTNFSTFAAFKNHNNTLEVAQQLVNSGGERRTFEQFKKEALKISERYNKNWLRSEYMHANRSAAMAEKWQRAVQNKDLYPSIRYLTAGDSKVRPDHQQIDGSVYPIDHPFWATHLPPNDWGCRCTVESTRSKQTQKGELELKPMFSSNYGKEPPFDKSHPYFTTPQPNKALQWAARFDQGYTRQFLAGNTKPPTLVPRSLSPKSQELEIAKEFNNRGHLVEFMPNGYIHGKKHIDAMVFNRLNEFKQTTKRAGVRLETAVKQAEKSKNKIDVSIKVTSSNEMTFARAKGQLKEVAKRKPKANINDVHIFIDKRWRKYNYKNLAK